MKTSALVLLQLLAVVAFAQVKTPFELKRQKWQATAPFGNRGAFLMSSGSPTSIEVVALIDQGCWAKSPQLAWLSQQVSINLKKSPVQSFRIRLDGGPSSRTDLVNNPCVLGVGNSGKLSLHDADPMIRDQRHMEMIGALELADDLNGGKFKSEVTLAVIDTGLDMKHPEFTNLWINEVEARGQPNVDDDNNGYVDDIHGYNFVDKIGNPAHKTSNDHGTHVAGLAAACLANGVGGAGVMGKNIKLMVLNVVGSNWDEVDLTDVEEAIRYAADNGADVINISSGGRGEFPTMGAALAYAINKGLTTVVSAGNNKEDIDKVFYSPASYAKDYAGVISVSATDLKTGNLCDFSNFGVKAVKVSAPGCDTGAPRVGLLSTLRNAGYGYKRGTSQAAPLASGAVSMLYSYIKDKGQKPNPGEVEKLLMESSPRGLDIRGLRQSLRN